MANNNAAPSDGLTIIQVRGGSGAASSGGRRVMGCVGISSLIPVCRFHWRLTMPKNLYESTIYESTKGRKENQAG